jgi:transcriptional regulator with XRE-family HTH domain
MIPMLRIRDASLPMWPRQRPLDVAPRHVPADEALRGELPQGDVQLDEAGPARRRGGPLFRLRLERGWNLDRLARKAGLSRTTVYGLECGAIARPRASTLRRLAEALGLPAADLGAMLAAEAAPRDAPRLGDGGGPSAGASASGPRELSTDFDRRTNPRVDEVVRHDPTLFAGWSREDWDQLYSTFGVGGSLSDEGVVAQAERINRQRELTFKLQLLLQTHLAGAAEEFVNRLYGQVTGEGALREATTTVDR